jgi:Uma2 family endonuclease
VNIKSFIPVVPDFVIELRSATDNLSYVRTKMIEYQRIGVKLGLLINPQDQKVDIYRQGEDLEILDAPAFIDCGGVMAGFILSMSEIW